MFRTIIGGGGSELGAVKLIKLLEQFETDRVNGVSLFCFPLLNSVSDSKLHSLNACAGEFKFD